MWKRKRLHRYLDHIRDTITIVSQKFKTLSKHNSILYAKHTKIQEENPSKSSIRKYTGT